MDVVAKLRQRGKKDQSAKLLCDIKSGLKTFKNYIHCNLSRVPPPQKKTNSERFIVPLSLFTISFDVR